MLRHCSLTRIADLDRAPYESRPLPPGEWEWADYVIAEVRRTPGSNYLVELRNGRMVQVMPGDRIVGAFGDRAATLEGVGSWTAIEHGKMHAMTSAGLFGAFSSLSAMIPQPMELDYHGHVIRGDCKLRMADFALSGDSGTRIELRTPTVLLVGTSMSAGKTTTGRVVTHLLSSAGFSVIGCKLTGAGRFRDIMTFKDAGAAAVYDFVDAGLPSTVVPEDEFRSAIRPLLAEIGRQNADFLVVEAGASPLEPYNGSAAIDELGDNIRTTILCASDPYSVVGVQKAFGLTPDLVSGPATSTSAAIDLVRRLSSVEGVNVMDPASRPILGRALEASLGVRIPGAATDPAT